jgi:hypothetical protein
MSELSVLDNSISRCGLRTLHVARMGKEIDLEQVREMIPAEADCITWRNWDEDELGIHHFAAFWGAREVVRLEIAGQVRDLPLPMRDDKNAVVFWWIGEDEDGKAVRTSWAIDLAATLHRLRLGGWPVWAGMRDVPKNAPEVVKVRDESGQAEVRVVGLDWAPCGFVVVGKGVSNLSLALP